MKKKQYPSSCSTRSRRILKNAAEVKNIEIGERIVVGENIEPMKFFSFRDLFPSIFFFSFLSLALIFSSLGVA